jgi:PAS domain S-box-containing protein
MTVSPAQPQKTLSKDLTRKLIAIVLSIFTVTSIFSLWFYSYESKKTYLNSHSEYLSYLTDNLRLPLWNVDQDWISSICSTFSKNEVVSLLRVASEEGEILFSMVNESEPSLIVNKKPVYHNEVLVGTVELGFTTRLYQETNFQMFFRSMLPMLFVVLGLMIANSLLFSRLVGRPLNHLMTRIEGISAGNYNELDSHFEHSEIARILDKFNYMANRVKERELSLLETNKRLESEIVDRQEAEKARIESERRYQQLVEELPVGVFRSSAAYDGRYVMVNPAFIKMLEYKSAEDLTEKSVKQIYRDPHMREMVLEMLFREGTVKGLELEMIKSDGRSLAALVTAHVVADPQGKPQYIEGIIEDITARNNLEKQMRQAQKMEAIGTLAGGIAHDFNNILASIFGFAEAAKMRYGKGQNVEKYFDEILDAGLRARSLIKQMLTFSRQTEVKKEAISIGPIIKETIKFLRASLPAMIEIKRTFQVDDGVVWADPTHIHQIVMNLCTNSAHAMREHGGILEICLDEVEVSGEDGRLDRLAPGRYVKLSVIDNGHGISPEIQERIFEPFFTTKPRGEGTGMGLAVIHGLVSDMGGAITVESSLGQGARFHVFLPELDGEKLVGQASPRHLPKEGRERILFVDDEEGFIRSCQDILEQLGYAVVTAANGLEAYEIFRQEPDSFDLVVTDMAMPKMTGLELAKKVKALNGSIPIILCTGFKEGITEDVKQYAGIYDILLKPVLARELTEAIQKALEMKTI